MEIRWFALLCVVLGGMGQGVVLPKLPELLHESTRLAFDSGLSATMMYLGIFVSTFQYGKAADAGKVHWLLAGGLIAYSGSLVALAFLAAPWAIFATRFWEGISISAVYVAADFILGRLSKASERGRWLSYYGVALSVGLMLGPLLVIALPKALVWVYSGAGMLLAGPRLPLLLVALLAILLAFFSLVYRVPKIYLDGAVKKPNLSTNALACGSAYGYMEAGLVAVFPVLAVARFHVTTEYCLVVIIIMAALFSILWGEAADRLGARVVILTLLALLAGGSAAFFLRLLGDESGMASLWSLHLYGLPDRRPLSCGVCLVARRRSGIPLWLCFGGFCARLRAWIDPRAFCHGFFCGDLE